MSLSPHPQDVLRALGKTLRRSCAAEVPWASSTWRPISSFRSQRVPSRKTFKYRLYPTRQQEQTLLFFLRRCRDLYNAGLEERRTAYQMRHASLSCFEQINELPDLKQAFPAYQDVPAHVLQDVLRRLDKAFAAFFRRLRNGEQPGYPRFKRSGRYHSFTYPDVAGWKLQGDRLNLAGIGEVRVKLHRALSGTIKTVTVRRDVDQWYVTFSCEVPVVVVCVLLLLLHFEPLQLSEELNQVIKKLRKRINPPITHIWPAAPSAFHNAPEFAPPTGGAP